MRATTRLSVIALVLLALTACSGGDSDGDRAEAAEWCKITQQLDAHWDDRDGERPETLSTTIDYTVAADWVDAAPSEIRESTGRMAEIMKQPSFRARAADLADVRAQIADYAEDTCPEPVKCIGDVEGHPRFPCV